MALQSSEASDRLPPPLSRHVPDADRPQVRADPTVQQP